MTYPYLNPGHFKPEELIRSQTATRKGIDNTPSKEQWAILQEGAWDFLEVTRNALGPIIVTSGYRCPALNRALGSSKRSDHQVLKDVCAFDIIPIASSLFDTFVWIHNNFENRFHKLIWEFDEWLHISWISIHAKRSPKHWVGRAHHVTGVNGRRVRYSKTTPGQLEKLLV
jgi:hypothetical protein